MKKHATYHFPKAPAQSLILLGQMLEFARKDRHWRQSELAERIGITRQTLARMEAGGGKVAIGHYFAAAWLLDLPIFPGMENPSLTQNNSLIQFFELLKNKYPQRILSKSEKKIENDF